jgi:uncharacterized protein (DUF1684 family)
MLYAARYMEAARLVSFVCSALWAAAGTPMTSPDFDKAETDWRAHREAKLTAPDGWLSVAGLSWLHAGIAKVGSDPQSDIVLPATAPRLAGSLQMAGGVVTLLPAKGAGVTINGKPAGKVTLKPDSDNHPDVVQVGHIGLTIIKRGNRTGVRIRDSDAVTRRDFTGLKWFPISQAWLVKARWVAYPTPKKIRIMNILGMTDEEPSPGYAEFTIGGKTLRLDPVDEDGDLSFMFKDATSGNTTYAPGRFLDADKPQNGVIVLDFNQSYNPPCAFTAYATCPLPPKQNTLPIAVEAGEKKYSDHAAPAGGSR